MRIFPHAVAVIGVAMLAACAPSDYSDGITAFSAAVTKADAAEKALIATDQQNTLDLNIAQVGRGNLAYAPPDPRKCAGDPGPYHAGDCAVQFGGQPFSDAAETPSLGSVTKYAALLSSVVADKTCASLDTDAKSLSTAIGDVAKDAGDAKLAAPAGALETIVSTLSCFAIESMQLRILKTATRDANPIVQAVVKTASDKDTLLQANALNVTLAQLSAAAVRYRVSHSATDLKQMVTLSQAVEQAQLAPAAKVIQSLGQLHQTLTDDLQSPAVNLKRIQNDAQALVTAAGALETSAITLAKPASVSAAKAASP